MEITGVRHVKKKTWKTLLFDIASTHPNTSVSKHEIMRMSRSPLQMPSLLHGGTWGQNREHQGAIWSANTRAVTEVFYQLHPLAIDHLHRSLNLMHKLQQACVLALPTPALLCTNHPCLLSPVWQQGCKLMDTKFQSFAGGLLPLWRL